jgi:PPP family 3-phenylpropionic acid transporter
MTSLAARLGGFYFFYFSVIGALVPYLGPYLDRRGFEPVLIGQLVSIVLGMRILAPGLWALFADRAGRRAGVIRVASLTSMAAFALLTLDPGPAGLAVALALFAFSWTGLLPQYEATTLSHLGEDIHRYGHVRVWGSVGFILATLLGGLIFAGPGALRVPEVVLVVMTAVVVAAWMTPDAPPAPHPRESAGLMAAIRRPPVLALFAVLIFQLASFGPYYVFFTLYVEEAGYSTRMAGFLWSWGAAAEILLFLYAPRLLRRYSLSLLMQWALAATAVRWVLTALMVDNLAVLLFCQTLHLAGFGLFHAVAVVLIHRWFSGRLQGRGQALYSSIGFGVGGGLGSFYSGYAWESLGPSATYLIAAGLAAAGWFIAWLALDTSAVDGAAVESGAAKYR